MDRPEGMSEAEIKHWCEGLKCKHLKSPTQRSLERYGGAVFAGLALFILSYFASSAFLFGAPNPYNCLVVLYSPNGTESCGGIMTFFPPLIQSLVALAVVGYSAVIGFVTFKGLSKQDKFELQREQIHLAWLAKMRANYNKHHK